MRASELFSDTDRQAIEDAVREAEGRTSAEIVPVVATASDRYRRAEDIMAVWCAVMAYVVLGIVSPEHQIDFWEGFLVLGLALGAGVLLANRVPAIKRLLAGQADMEGRAFAGAVRAFRTFGAGDTKGRTGVVIYVSLFERRAVVLGDAAIGQALSPTDYAAIRDLLLEGLRAGKPAEGFVAAIRRTGQLLAKAFPRDPGDVDEIANTLRILD